ncbi:recombinase A [Tieghemostelium lacteum]|uniref:Recombinase A n=1 Tax=Tieghemostelium lacteum TaxID=361077 RepID=A0A151ZBE9_TIELA|nr:recombinase A [Tieghemostelium lacteum]|eukprot:KYQ91261.1 recombinase A [Tieghemostelium lacteum]
MFSNALKLFNLKTLPNGYFKSINYLNTLNYISPNRITLQERFFSKKKKISKIEDEDDTEAAVSDKKSSTSSSNNKMDIVLKDLEKSFGKGTLMKLGSSFSTQKVDTVPTGSLGLDIALGIGGLPKGRVVEIFGPESSGKTTLALHVIAQAQKLGGQCTFIDAEHALNPQWAQKIGVNIDELFVSQPDSGEQALEIADTLLKSKTMSVIVIDSVAALVPRVELDGEMGDSHVGVTARLMSQALRKLSPNLKESNTILIFINQIRMKIGVMFGNPETTSGGNALKFFASLRMDIRKVGAVKKGDEIIASQVKVKVVKNKLAPPFREAIFDIDFESGINKTGEIIDLAVQENIVDKAGAWYTYSGSQLGQGREKTKAYLEQNINVLNEIEQKLRKKLLDNKKPLKLQNDEMNEENEEEIEEISNEEEK